MISGAGGSVYKAVAQMRAQDSQVAKSRQKFASNRRRLKRRTRRVLGGRGG